MFIIGSFFDFSTSSLLFLSTSYNKTESLSAIYPAISNASSTIPPPLFLKSIINDVIPCFSSSSYFALKSSAVWSSNDENAIYPILFSSTSPSTGFTLMFSLFISKFRVSFPLNISSLTVVPS